MMSYSLKILLILLINKKVITEDEARNVVTAGQLVNCLDEKSLLSLDDFNDLSNRVLVLAANVHKAAERSFEDAVKEIENCGDWLSDSDKEFLKGHVKNEIDSGLNSRK